MSPGDFKFGIYEKNARASKSPRQTTQTGTTLGFLATKEIKAQVPLFWPFYYYILEWEFFFKTRLDTYNMPFWKADMTCTRIIWHILPNRI